MTLGQWLRNWQSMWPRAGRKYHTWFFGVCIPMFRLILWAYVPTCHPRKKIGQHTIELRENDRGFTTETRDCAEIDSTYEGSYSYFARKWPAVDDPKDPRICTPWTWRWYRKNMKNPPLADISLGKWYVFSFPNTYYWFLLVYWRTIPISMI